MSVIHRFSGNISNGDYAWEGVQPVEINTKDVQGILKHVLVGPADDAPTFIIRYFQVPAGERTYHHDHPHEHGMVILHGTAKIQIKDDFFELNPMDAVFLSGGDRHQVENTGNHTLGFLCIIPRLESES